MIQNEQNEERILLLRHSGTVMWHTSKPEDLAVADQIWFVENGRLARTNTGSEYSQDRWEENRRFGWPDGQR